MKFGKHIGHVFAAACVIIAIIVSGCGSARVSLMNFEPEFNMDQSVYEGKHVYLMNFENQANNTSIWYYLSPDKKFSYGTDTFIHNYFWYSFHAGLVKAGFLVSNLDNPDTSAPAMWLTLRSITDAKFSVDLTVQLKGITVFAEHYVISEPPLLGDKRTPDNLEKRAYKMTNRLIEIILSDPGFKKVFI